MSEGGCLKSKKLSMLSGIERFPRTTPLDVQFPVGSQAEMLYEEGDGSHRWYEGTITRSALCVDPKGAPDLSYSIRFPGERVRSYKLSRNSLRAKLAPNDPPPPSPPPSPTPGRSLRSRSREASSSALPVPATRRRVYQDSTTDGHRIAECTWLPSDGADAGHWLLRWLRTQDLRDATLNVIVTFFDDCGTWVPWTIACESLLLPGQYGLFAACDFGVGETIGFMRDGILGTYGERSDALRDEISRLREVDGAHYLYVLPTRQQGRVTLHDGRLSRPGGPRNANDARGSTLWQNCRFMEDGRLLVRTNISRLRPNATVTQLSRAEILWDYGPGYWSVPLRHMVPMIGRRVSIWFRGDPGRPWGSGYVLRADVHDTHVVQFDDGWVASFHLAQEQLDGQLRWDNDAGPNHQRMERD